MGAPVSIDPELLQRQEGWLRRLALELAGDPQLSEDVLQETWLAAIERPPAVAGDESRLRSWLARVLRNRVLLDRRGSARRRAREERCSLDEATADVAETVQRAELMRGLMEAVLELPPPQRDVVLLRYLEDQPPREIAQRLGQSDAAVRSRLARGLASLRARLDGEHEAGRRGWTAAFLLHFPPNGPGGALAPLLMKTQTKIVLVALLAVGAVGTFELLREEGPAPGGEALALTAGALEGESPGQPPGREDTTAPEELDAGRARVAVPPKEESPVALEPARRVRGIVRDATRAPVGGVEVWSQNRRASSWGFEGMEPVASTTTDAQGGFELDAPDPHGRVAAADPSWVSLLDERFAGEVPGRELELFVAPRRDYRGIVVDTEGLPVEGSWLSVQLDAGLLASLRPGVKRDSTPMWSSTSDEEGAFALDGVPWIASSELVVNRSGFEQLVIDLPAERWWELRLVLERTAAPTGDLRGVVVDVEGVAQPDAWVYHGENEVETDVQGRFVMPRDASSTAVVVLKQGYLPREETLGQGTIGELRLVLDGEPLELEVRVLDAEGEPVPRAHVWTSDGKPLPGSKAYRRMHYEDLLGGARGLRTNRDRQTDDEGRTTLSGLLPASYVVHAMHPRTLEIVSEGAEAGGAITFRFEASAAARRVAGRVLSLSGAPIAKARLLLGRDDAGGAEVPKTPWVIDSPPTTDEQGRFELAALCTAGAFFHVIGEGINGARFDLDGVADLENIEIRLPLRCSFQVLLEQDPREADWARVLDEAGNAMEIQIEYGDVGGGATAMFSGWRVRLEEGASDVIHVDEQARTLVLLRGGVEVRRVPIRLVPGEIQVLRL